MAAYRIVEEGWDAARAVKELGRYQNFVHGVFFASMASYVRTIEPRRAEWRERLATMPDPPVRRVSTPRFTQR